ncbi:guanine deaminase [Novosphingobium aquimarinum]|uniref:guanine deaminase n=1 Tax=Novosphingobium aquimarinum TaxID=2682494 RepID=UPI0018DE0F62|nr:guanine deaminase [Novosphingobium aquimarinum]
MVAAFAICGDLYHTPTRGCLEALADCLIEVGETGRIERMTRADEPAYASRLERADRLIRLQPGQCLLPGFVDCHVHAPQWPQLGTALDRPLEQWLDHYTFPLEAKFADTAYAREVYADLVATLLAHGTTTAVYFGTVHVDATVALAEICLEHGQRALIGKVAMDDREQCPDFYRDADVDAALAATAETIARIRALQPGEDHPLVLPAITPRFLPSCTDDLLAGLGALARETGCHVQTHCSESDWEVAHSAGRFGATDTAVLDRFGLLATRAVLAHSNFVTADDRAIIKARNAAIAHCPLSNVYFANAVLPLREALDEGVHVGLGSDIAGGSSPSILDNARMAMTISRLRASGMDAAVPASKRGAAGTSISVAEAFWLATAGGGEALGLPIGLFAEGAEFDAILVDPGTASSDLRMTGGEPNHDRFEHIVRCARSADLSAVWVRGRQVRNAR